MKVFGRRDLKILIKIFVTVKVQSVAITLQYIHRKVCAPKKSDPFYFSTILRNNKVN